MNVLSFGCHSSVEFTPTSLNLEESERVLYRPDERRPFIPEPEGVVGEGGLRISPPGTGSLNVGKRTVNVRTTGTTETEGVT